MNELKTFATSSAHGDDALSPEDITFKVVDLNIRLYAVFFPMAKTQVVMGYWKDPGDGLSSRAAEEGLKHIDQLHEVTGDEPAPIVKVSPAHGILKQRIVDLLERAPVGPPRSAKVKVDDVYLYSTGMAAIYRTHMYLLSKFNAKSVLFGMAFHSTTHVLEGVGPGSKWYGLGTAEDLLELETYLKEEAKEGRKVQAVYAEFPCNPTLTTPDLAKLRKLADEYGFVLVVDDTIGSFCNVDLLSIADILITSLTKSFSGYADVVAGSAVLNPSGARYRELKALFDEKYSNFLFNADAEVLEHNSRDYLSRSVILNKNAEGLSDYLSTLVSNPKSSVVKVYYPKISTSASLYKPYMRQPTAEFTPGYGCLFSFEFRSMATMEAFYNELNLHIGPHLGAHLTLVMSYVAGLYPTELEWAAKYDMRPTQLRVSVGLEDTEELIGVFRDALVFADAVKEEAEPIVMSIT